MLKNVVSLADDLVYFLVPSHTPEQFKAINKSSPTSIPLTWKPIRDPFYIHGILRGYKIEFRMTHLAGSALRDDNDTVIHTVGPNTLSHVLTDLEIYAVYRIKIRAFTVKGDGVLSEISAGKFFILNTLSFILRRTQPQCKLVVLFLRDVQMCINLQNQLVDQSSIYRQEQQPNLGDISKNLTTHGLHVLRVLSRAPIDDHAF